MTSPPDHNSTHPELVPEIKPGRLYACPLGGVGEIGLNSYMIQYEDSIILIDCGHMTPESEMLGIDLVIPDFSYIIKNSDKLKAVFLTHAHDDHTGALPYLLSNVETPVYGTTLTLGFVMEKMKEFEIGEKASLREIRPRTSVEIGPFTITPFRVTHSVADSVGFAIETPVGNLVFSGDYKLEPNPRPGDYFDFHTLTSFAEKGILALFADSTNVERQGSAPSERKVYVNLDRIFSRTQSTLVVSAFASSIHRIQTIFDLAEKYNRDVFVAGMNMERNIRVASELGYLKIPEKRIHDVKKIDTFPPKKRLLLSTGSQGEPLSVMSRLSRGDFKWFKIKPGDVVVLSSRMIPGNEKSILKIVNHFSRRGARIFYEWTDSIHASGHAYRDEMKHLIQLTRPRYLVPVHGEYRHLIAHLNLAAELEMQKKNVIVNENGGVLELHENKISKVGKIPIGRILVDGKRVGDVGDVVLRDRMHLSKDGMLIAILAIDNSTGELLAGPYIVTRGFVYVDKSEELLQEAEKVILECFQNLDRESMEDWGVVKVSVRRALRKFLKNKTAAFPMILPVVLEV